MELTKQDIKNLKDKDYRKEHSLILVEGEKFCHDVYEMGSEIIYTITTDKNTRNYPNIVFVNEKQLSQIATTKTAQNIVMVVKIKSIPIQSQANALILDRLQDPGNVGTLIRSAMAFGFKDIYLVNCADPYSEKVIRSSAGMILKARIHIVTFKDILLYKDKIADKFVVADMFGAPIGEIRLPKTKIAVIIGNEGSGVSADFIALADTKISIPMQNGVESLNAGVAGSIIMQKLSEV